MFCPSFHQHRGMVPSVGIRDHYGWINYWKRARDHRNKEKPTDAYLDKLLPREFVLLIISVDTVSDVQVRITPQLGFIITSNYYCILILIRLMKPLFGEKT